MNLIGLTILAVIFTIISWRDLKAGIFVLTLTLPTYLWRFELLGLPSTLLEVMVLILTVVWITNNHSKIIKKDFWEFTKGWRLPITLIILAATVAIFVPNDLISALGIYKAYFIEPILIFFILATTLKDKKDLQNLILALGVSALVVSIYALTQKLTGLHIPAPWDTERRVTSFFPYPNAVGLYLGPIIILGSFALYELIKVKGKGLLIFFWILTLSTSVLAIVFSQSEAAWIAVGSVLFLVSLFHKKLRRLTIPIAVIIASLVMIVPSVRTPVIEKVTLQDFSGLVRQLQWQETWAMLKDRPIFGAGLNGFPKAYAPYQAEPEKFEIFQYPHNIFLNIWVELGLFGLLVFLYLVIRLMGLLRCYQQSPHNDQTTTITYTGYAVLLEMFIHGLADVPYLKNDLAILTWMVFAIIIISTKYGIHPNPQK
ncbi:O-antigen ligase family protein [Patescibacteria group bacterium]